MLVYFHRNPKTYEIFYVGIGNNSRPYSLNDRNKFWHNYVDKHGNPVIQIVHSDITKVKSVEWEKYYIAILKRRFEGGQLVNLTPGGECGSDDPEIRKLASQRTTEYFNKNPEAKIDISEKLKEYYKKNPYVNTATIDKARVRGEKHSSKREDVKEKIRISNLGQKRTEGTRLKMKLAKLGKTQKPQHIENRRLTAIGSKRSEETKSKMKLAQVINYVAVKMIDLQTSSVINAFPSITDAARHLNIKRAEANISNSCKGKIMRAYGYKWEYALPEAGLAV